MPNPEFKIYSGILKAYESEDGRKRIKTTASSTIRDLHGDMMTESAIRQMAAQAEGRMTIFLNHSYDVPEDVFGSVEKAAVVFRDEFVDLDFDIVVEESNPRALKTYDAIKNGTKLGTSIGALVNHWSEAKDGGWIIDDVLLLEASIVSIPANPRSWVEYAVKALKRKDVEETPAPPPLLPYPVTWQASNTGSSAIGHWTITGFPTKQEESAKEEAEEAEGASEPPVIEAEAPETEKTAACSGDCEQGCACGKSCCKSVDPEETQEAPESTPEAVESGTAPVVTAENDPSTEAQAVLSAADAGLLKDVTEVISALKATLTQLVETRSALAESEEARRKAEEERDLAGESLLTAKEIVDKVADLPLSRKTQYIAARTEFDEKMTGIYGEEFMRVLRSNKK